MKATLIDSMGTDLTVCNAARVSMDKESEWDFEEGEDEHGVYWDYVLSEKDQKLISYLAKHNHWTPFSHCTATFRIKAPIFVARQLFKHKVGLTENEISRRYVDTPPEFYIPDVWRKRAENVKQGSSTEALPKPKFTEGYCIGCGAKIESPSRPQGGGQIRKYCSVECKTKITNAHRNPYKVVFDNAKARVKREGRREWSLDFETFEFPSHCPYLGIELDYSYGKGIIKPNSPSFDRIDPSKGYINGNVEIVSQRANSMKNDANVEDQIKMAEAVLLRHKGFVPNYEHTPEGLNQKAINLYRQMIEAGYCAEQARMVLPQSMYTEFYWTGSLAAFARVCQLRLDPHAQKETQIIAQMINDECEKLWPVSWGALMDD